MLAGAIGSGIVVGCGGSGGGGGGGTNPGTTSPAPNGFKFVELTNNSTLQLPLGNAAGQRAGKFALQAAEINSPDVDSFTGNIQLTSGSLIFFQAVDGVGNVVLMVGTLVINEDGSAALTNIQRLVGTNDVLPDGRTVVNIGFGLGNAAGTYVTILYFEDQPPEVWIGTADGGLEPLMVYGDDAPGGNGSVSGNFRSVVIDDDGNVAFVVSYVPEGTTSIFEGLFLLVGGDPNHPDSGLLVSTEDINPDGGLDLQSLGLVSLGNGTFTVQSTTETSGGSNEETQSPSPSPTPTDEETPPEVVTPTPTPTETPTETPTPEDTPTPTPTPPDEEGRLNQQDGLPNSVVLTGKFGNRTSLRMASAGPRAAVNPLLKDATDLPEGSSVYGPRITADGVVVQVLHLTGDDLALYYGDRLVVQTGQPSPRGAVIGSMSPPVCGADNRVYILLYTEEGVELAVYDGSTLGTILGYGDEVGGRIVIGIIFGMMPNQVDSQDHVVCIVDYEDDTTGILVGLPI